MKPELKQLIGFAAAAAVCLGARALTASPAGPSSDPSTQPAVAEPIDGDAIASIDEDLRYFPTSRPSVPPAQHPPLATPENVDTNKPVHQWQRLTDDWFGVRPKLDD